MPDRQSYSTIFDALYRGIVEAGAQVRILHMAQLLATDAELEFVRDYAFAGGHLVVGIRRSTPTHRREPASRFAPPVLSAAAGVRYEEFSNLESTPGLSSTGARKPARRSPP
jgi:beta-galactosidase